MRRLLIANRGEIAVRVIRACRDAGLTSIAVYADPDRDARHVRLADEAVALGGDTAARSYLDIARVVAAAVTSSADAVHPGYGFLSENADFAAAVQDAGLLWIGPPPAAIRALGDKVEARRVAHRVGAPFVAGTPDPVGSADEVVAFAERHGLPVAIKATLGGGGRGMKVARTLAEIPDMFAAAVREAGVAFGREDCFVERYLDRARHVETQCLADVHGGVVVVSTRDCTLQRRHQKVVEEAPAPYVGFPQQRQMVDASCAILADVGYVGAATCEFLLGADGSVSFLEVNTRLQVEHPVTEEVTGVDLVREQFRLAEGGHVDRDLPAPRGHAIEFRINAEDAACGFLPAPGVVTRWRPPEGPGVRLDSGVEVGTEIGAGFDSMLAKVIVTGSDRRQAIERARRALAEFEVDGVPTVLPFHRAVLTDPAFVDPPESGGFTIHTRWIETEFDHRLTPFTAPAGEPTAIADDGRSMFTVEVGARRVEVSVPAHLFGAGRPVPTGPPRQRSRRASAAVAGAQDPDSALLASPMHGSVVRVAVSPLQQVAQGDLIAVLEAMKMEQPVTAHRAGVVVALPVHPGDTVSLGDAICEIHPTGEAG